MTKEATIDHKLTEYVKTLRTYKLRAKYDTSDFIQALKSCVRASRKHETSHFIYVSQVYNNAHFLITHNKSRATCPHTTMSKTVFEVSNDNVIKHRIER